MVVTLNDLLTLALKEQKLRDQLIQQDFAFVPLGPDHLKKMITQGLVKMKKSFKKSVFSQANYQLKNKKTPGLLNQAF